MDWGSFLKDMGKATLKVATEANPALGMIAPLVDIAEDMFGHGSGPEKKAFVFSTIKGLLVALDNNEEAEFGVKDWAMSLEGVESAIEAHVKIRNATNWWPTEG